MKMATVRGSRPHPPRLCRRRRWHRRRASTGAWVPLTRHTRPASRRPPLLRPSWPHDSTLDRLPTATRASTTVTTPSRTLTSSVAYFRFVSTVYSTLSFIVSRYDLIEQMLMNRSKRFLLFYSLPKMLVDMRGALLRVRSWGLLSLRRRSLHERRRALRGRVSPAARARGENALLPDACARERTRTGAARILQRPLSGMWTFFGNFKPPETSMQFVHVRLYVILF